MTKSSRRAAWKRWYARHRDYEIARGTATYWLKKARRLTAEGAAQHERAAQARLAYDKICPPSPGCKALDGAAE